MSIMRSICFLSLSLIGYSAMAQVASQSSTFLDCKNTAQAAGTPFMVYLYADWCLPCQTMEEGTFQDRKLAESLLDQVDFYKIDFDSEIGKLWSSQFAVACLPTTIYFDAEGNVLDRVESSYSTSECLSLLTMHNLIQPAEALSVSSIEVEVPKAQLVTAGSREVQIKNSMTAIEELLSSQELGTAVRLELTNSLALLEKELSIPVKGTKQEELEENIPVARFASHQEVVSTPIVSPVIAEIYVVQLGLFRVESNAVMLSNEVNSKTSLQTYIVKEQREGQQVYRVVSKEYSDRSSANIAYTDVKDAGYNAFVKTK